MFNQALELVDLWPTRPESATRAELLAAVADLCFLERALDVGKIADRIEEELTRWKT